MRANQEQREFWQRHVNALRQSGLKRKDYCRKHGRKIHQLDYRRRRLQSQAAPSEGRQPEGWIRLHVQDEEVINGSSSICSRMRIGRVTIELDARFDPSILAEVVRIPRAIC